MLAEPEPPPAWHTPAPRQRRRTSRAWRRPHGLQEGKHGEGKPNLEGEGGMREGAEVSPGSIPQKPRRSGAGTVPGWPQTRSGRGSRSRPAARALPCGVAPVPCCPSRGGGGSGCYLGGRVLT